MAEHADAAMAAWRRGCGSQAQAQAQAQAAAGLCGGACGCQE